MFESFQKAAWEGKDCYCSQGVGAGSKRGGWRGRYYKAAIRQMA
nr:MAG TPA: hypothetical protein [Caudoviricetes sp.]